MIYEQFLETIPQNGIGGFVGKIFKNVTKSLKKVAPIIGGGIGFMIAGPVGAGIGSGIGGLVAGQDPAQALQTAALGYGIGSLAGITPGLKGFAGKGFAGIPGTSWGDKWNILKPSSWEGFGGNLFKGKTPGIYEGTDPLKIKAQEVLSNPQLSCLE